MSAVLAPNWNNFSSESEKPAGLSNLRKALKVVLAADDKEKTQQEKILEALDKCRLSSLKNPPVRPPVILQLGDKRLGEAGNLVILQGQAKSEKQPE